MLHQHLKTTEKTNSILKMNLIISAETLQISPNQMKILNLKKKQSYYRRQYDQTHKQTEKSEKTKTAEAVALRCSIKRYS